MKPSNSRDGGRPLTSHYTSPDGRLCQFKALCSLVGFFFFFFNASFVQPAQTGHPRSLSSSQHTLSCSLAELPSQIVMSVPQLGKNPPPYMQLWMQSSSFPMDGAPLLPSPCSLDPLPLPSGVASLIFRRARSLSSSHFWNGEDVVVEGDTDPRKGIVSDWDLFAEELGKFGHSLLRTSCLTGFFMLRRFFYLRP